MDIRRLQQLAGTRPLFEQNEEEDDLYMDWEDQAKQEFIENHSDVTDDPDELTVDSNGSVYHSESGQRWPANTVTSYEQWKTDQQADDKSMTSESADQTKSVPKGEFKQGLQRYIEGIVSKLNEDATPDQVKKAFSALPQHAADDWKYLQNN